MRIRTSKKKKSIKKHKKHMGKQKRQYFYAHKTSKKKKRFTSYAFCNICAHKNISDEKKSLFEIFVCIKEI